MATETSNFVLTGQLKTVEQRIKRELDKISSASGAANVIESVSIDGTTQTITNKNVTLDLSAYAKKTDISSVYKIKGTVVNFAALPNNAEVGDVYNITNAGGTDENGVVVKAGDNIVKTSTGWDNLGGTFDISGKADKVTNATSGNLAALDSNGNLIDSGHGIATDTEINSMLTEVFGAES